MSTEAHEALWADASEQLRNRLGNERFERWLAPLKVLSKDGPEILLAVANEFMRDWIEHHYSKRITEALELDGARRVTFALKVAPELFAEVSREKQRIFDAVPPAAPSCPGRRHGAAPTLESFVVGVSNRLAYNGALHVLECPGRRYNPLFVHGPTGVGKTHLLKGAPHGSRTRATNG